MTQGATLAEFVAGLDHAHIPTEVIARAETLLLDQIGCQIAGASLPLSRALWESLAPWTPHGPSTVMGVARGASAASAAFLNGTFGHSNESDDTHVPSPTHPGAVVIPAALAMAEEQGSSGEELLTAIVAGYEAVIRVAYSVSPHLTRRGHHPPPAVGPFGAAAAAASLVGAPAALTLDAFGIAGSFSGGITEYTRTGGSVKRIHCGIPAEAGVRAVRLAQAGMTGPPTVLEGERGFCAVFADHHDAEALVRGLGTEWLMLETALKHHACCYAIQPALDGLADMRRRRPFGAEDVERIVVRTRNRGAYDLAGRITRPTDLVEAQFSLSFAVALLLTRGDCGFWAFAAADLDDPELLALADRTRFVVSDEDTGTGDFTVGVLIEVELKDGTRLGQRADHALGQPERPMSAEQVQHKFENLTAPVLGPDVADEIATAVLDARHLSGSALAELMAAIRVATAPGA